MSKTPLKKIIKSKIKTNKELTPEEKMREKIKYEIAEELGITDRGCKKAHKKALDEFEKIKNTIYSIDIDSSLQHDV